MLITQFPLYFCSLPQQPKWKTNCIMMVKKHLRISSKSNQFISVSDTSDNESKMLDSQRDISVIYKISEKVNDAILSLPSAQWLGYLHGQKKPGMLPATEITHLTHMHTRHSHWADLSGAVLQKLFRLIEAIFKYIVTGKQVSFYSVISLSKWIFN